VTETLIDARGVGRRFGARWALRDVTLAVQPGETVALVGPNGAGKTTLLDILAAARLPTEGAVSGAGSRAGFVPQRPALWRRLTTRENIELFARLGRLADPVQEAQRLLEATGLEAVAERPTGQLSVGQQQRVNVACGLIGSPSVVLLDEPTASLDPRQRRLLWRLLTDVTRGGGAVVFTTQNVEEVALHADRLVALVDGSVVFSGTVAEFRAQAASAEDEAFEDAFIRFLDAVGGGT
jgi:ABC-2 type transport system ATP-binding protein